MTGHLYRRHWPENLVVAFSFLLTKGVSFLPAPRATNKDGVRQISNEGGWEACVSKWLAIVVRFLLSLSTIHHWRDCSRRSLQKVVPAWTLLDRRRRNCVPCPQQLEPRSRAPAGSPARKHLAPASPIDDSPSPSLHAMIYYYGSPDLQRALVVLTLRKAAFCARMERYQRELLIFDDKISKDDTWS